MTPAYPILAILLLWLAAYTDLTRRVIRNWISLALVLLFVLYASFSVHSIDIVGHVIWAGMLFIVLATGFSFGKVGGGDVKLATAVMLWVGPVSGFDFLVITGICGGILALAIVIPIFRMIWEWAFSPFQKYTSVSVESADLSVPYGVAIAMGGTVALFGSFISGN
ncbi:A24 family peptidase [Sneathiella litorea]|nr:prepilin peptidase [Sneathiella litorea]